jgi:hypothetical protein
VTSRAERALVFACAVALGACATSGRESASAARQEIEQRKPVPVRDVSFAPLVLGQVTAASLTASSVVVEEEGRRTYARGFQLPDATGTLTLSVASLRTGSDTDPAIVYPDVRFLDSDHRVVGRIAPDRYVYRNTAAGPGLTAEAFIEPAMRARYVLVTERAITEAEQVATQSNTRGVIPLIVPIGAFVFYWPIPTGSSSPNARMHAAPAGPVSIKVDAYGLHALDPPRPAR